MNYQQQLNEISRQAGAFSSDIQVVSLDAVKSLIYKTIARWKSGKAYESLQDECDRLGKVNANLNADLAAERHANKNANDQISRLSSELTKTKDEAYFLQKQLDDALARLQGMEKEGVRLEGAVSAFQFAIIELSKKQ